MPRKLERTPLIYHLKVLNRTTDNIFGYLGNLTTEGALLFCPEAVALNTLFALDLRLPFPVDGSAQIPFNATGVWCRRDERLGMYAAGFRIESTDPGGSRLIADTIAALGSKERARRESQAE